MNYRTLFLSLTLLATATAGVAIAQTPSPAPAVSDAMHGMSGGSMQSGGMGMPGMMGMMMGKDPVGSCAMMMNKIAANPSLHKKMNTMMREAMSEKR